MAIPFASALVVIGLILLGNAAGPTAGWAQPVEPEALPTVEAPPAPEPVDTSLSPQCRVPGSKLYTLASLRALKAALREHRAIKVLAIGSSSTVGVGASSPHASYPMRLEEALEKLFPDIEINVENRVIWGAIAAACA